MKDIANKKGFTLIELLAVIALLAILVVFAVPKVYDYLKQGTDSALKLQEKNVEDAAKLYLEDYCKSPINYNFNCPDSIQTSTVNEVVKYYGTILASDLVEADYIDDVTFKGNSCTYNSYIEVTDAGKFTAYLCCGRNGSECITKSDNWDSSKIPSGE